MSSFIDCAREIVDRFGGVNAVSELTGRPPSTIRNWTSEEAALGIPRGWHSRLLILARDREVDLTVDELEKASRG